MFFGLGKKGKSRQKLKGDDSSQDAERLITATLALRIAPIAFIWCAPQFYDVCKKIIECAGYSLSTVIVWNKNHANFGAMGACYKPKFEMAVVCKTEKLPWFGPDNEVTVWDCNRAATNNFHPTQKPVELFARAINNHTFGPVTIYDPFLGSGTTLIACEQLGRKCYAMEISPAYVAVAIQRWVDLTGKEPKRIDDATRGRTTAKTNKASHPARQSKQAARARAAQ
jgi:DNA modification methylase